MIFDDAEVIMYCFWLLQRWEELLKPDYFFWLSSALHRWLDIHQQILYKKTYNPYSVS